MELQKSQIDHSNTKKYGLMELRGMLSSKLNYISRQYKKGTLLTLDTECFNTPSVSKLIKGLLKLFLTVKSKEDDDDDNAGIYRKLYQDECLNLEMHISRIDEEIQSLDETNELIAQRSFSYTGPSVADKFALEKRLAIDKCELEISIVKLHAKDELIDSEIIQTKSLIVQNLKYTARIKLLLTKETDIMLCYKKKLEEIELEQKRQVEKAQEEIEQILDKINKLQERITKELANIGAPSVSFAVKHLKRTSKLSYALQINILELANAVSYSKKVERGLDSFISKVQKIKLSGYNSNVVLLAKVKILWPKLRVVHMYIEESVLNVEAVCEILTNPYILKEYYGLSGLGLRAWINKWNSKEWRDNYIAPEGLSMKKILLVDVRSYLSQFPKVLLETQVEVLQIKEADNTPGEMDH